MADVDGPAWKVGQLARLTGLTVRTLHHYGQVGLLRPSARTLSGHRLYDEQDVHRLYRIVALRELGLSLEVIGDLLTGEPDLADLLRDHLAHVDRPLAAICALRRRLAAMVAKVQVIGPPPSVDLVALMEEVMKMDEIMKRYFTEEQLTALGQRHEQPTKTGRSIVRLGSAVLGCPCVANPLSGEETDGDSGQRRVPALGSLCDHRRRGARSVDRVASCDGAAGPASG